MRFVFCAEIVNNEQRRGLCIKINDASVLYTGELYTGEGEPYYLY